MKKTYRYSSLFEIKIGDKVLYDCNRRGTIRDIRVVPNGINDPKLVAILVIDLDGGGKVEATSDNFVPIVGEKYEELYPSQLL